MTIEEQRRKAFESCGLAIRPSKKTEPGYEHEYDCAFTEFAWKA